MPPSCGCAAQSGRAKPLHSCKTSRQLSSAHGAGNRYLILNRLIRLLALALAAAVLASAPALAAEPDPPSCDTVRLSDVGWADVTATTAVTAQLLNRLGYQTRITILSVPVTFNALHRKDIDVFLGNWMPMQEADRRPYMADGSLDVVRANLTDARYTLAVPDYAYAMGINDFAAVHKFAAQLGNKIYGIEPGNDGNRLVLGMIKDNKFGLGGFTLVESSEQGMLAEVERAVRTHQPIVFLGWQPHPMNDRFHMRYLPGGDTVFGPNFGGAKVYTDVRKGYLKECPNVGRLLQNLSFRVDDENKLMKADLDSGRPRGRRDGLGSRRTATGSGRGSPASRPATASRGCLRSRPRSATRSAPA